MRPALRAGLRPIWRDHDTVQIGVDARRAAAVSGGRGAAEVIRLLDGSRSREQIVAEANGQGVPTAVTERVIGLLTAAGAVIDYPADALRSIPCELRTHIRPVLETASLAHRDADGGTRLLARRATTTVRVRGCGQLADLIADLLTRSGVTTSLGDIGQPELGEAPDLTVVIGYRQPEELAELHRQQLCHLLVCISEATGVVGPLVRPGQSACVRCLDLARTDRDPAWPLIIAQLPATRMDSTAGDPVLATAVAAQAAAQALAYADRCEAVAPAENGTLELALPSWQWRRRTWPPHPACTCGATQSGAAR